ncbi:MAG TPA: hypothetical protein VK178_16015 [Opitutaceae bacterium]|nr:hypothetical protein [Opitutaceae bacterium]
MVLMLGISEYYLAQIAMKRVPHMADFIDLMIVLACVIGALATAVVCSVLITGSLHRQHCRLVYRAFPPFFNWSVEDDCIEALRFVLFGRGYLLKVRKRGEAKFRLVAISEGNLSQDIVSFLKET